MIKVAIVGANGYTGLELMKILCRHPQAELKLVCSRSCAGQPVQSVYPTLGFCLPDLTFSDPDVHRIASECDVVFTALPHTAGAELGGQLFDKGIKVIDLSADFRYVDTSVYETTYAVKHPRPDINAQAQYGLCELFRSAIARATVIGNPGCYTTASILPLYPLLKEGIVDSDDIVIDAKSGISGAGRKADVDYSFCETDENFKAYAVTTHRHTSEIEEKLSLASGKNVQVSFTPHLLPVKRGILATIYAKCKAGADENAVSKVYEKYYGNERFVRVSKGLPELKWVTGSNVCAIGFKRDARLNRLVIVSVLDNLIKGASGQAVQNMNILFGLNEGSGLTTPACHL